jgi:Myb/SANT-like DNA-binding domain
MAMEKKKSANFSVSEIEMLVEEVAVHRGVLFGKFGSGISNSMKVETWKKITEKINAGNGGEIRSVEGVKKKWYDMASKTKKKESTRRSEMKATGGGRMNIVMTAEEEKVVEILGNEAVEGINGGVEVGFECSMKVEEGSFQPEDTLALMEERDWETTDQPQPSTSAAVVVGDGKKTVKVANYNGC